MLLLKVEEQVQEEHHQEEHHLQEVIFLIWVEFNNR
jgi:hypothetical protein